MEKASFDDLLQAIRTAFEGAQLSLKRRSEEALRQRAEAEGLPKGIAPDLTFALPKIGVEGGQYEQITLPVSCFRQQRRTQISMLSLSFECALDEQWFPGATRVFRVIIGPKGNRSRRKSARRQMQVILHGADPPCGEVLLDGDLLWRLPGSETAGEARPGSKEKQSLLARVITLLRNSYYHR